MKRIFIGFIFLFLSSILFAAPETYLLDNQHSFVLWRIDHFGFSQQTGKFFADGSLVLNEANLEKSRVNVTIPIAGVDTGIKDLNMHLQGDLFFAAGANPIATFVSNKITLEGGDRADIAGLLTIRGVTKKIVIQAKFNKKGENPITNKKTVGFSGLAMIKRSDFGMTTLLPGLGDDVMLVMEVEAYKAS